MGSNRPSAMETARFLQQSVKTPPEIGFLTGTGLSEALEDLIDTDKTFTYEKIPHFPTSTVESHKGLLRFGSASGRQVMMMQGRFHLYEGYSPTQVCFPIRVMQEMGIKTLILSNAAGGINREFNAGDIMVICDHINLTGQNPLSGPNDDAWGLRFPDMTQVYDPMLMDLALKTADSLQIPVRKGVYAGLPGPSLETPAETRFLKTIGSDAVGFSTIMEAIAGVHAGMRILALSLITNINDPDNPAQTTMESVLKTAGGAQEKFSRLVFDIISQI